MSNSNKLQGNLEALKRRIVLTAVIWTIIVTGSLVWNIYQTRQQTRRLAKKEAFANLNKDHAIRYWADSHGGVYVPPSERTLPNDYLAHIQNRDVKTTSGSSLTLMNPAYILRQIKEDYADLYGIGGHLTSLKVLNPVNTADEWERKALLTFDQDAKELFEFVAIQGKPYLRLMGPLITKKTCLKCHAHQGYKVGDVRGGISVSVPMEPYLIEASKAEKAMILTHGIIFTLGVIAIGSVSKRGKKIIFERDQDEKKLMRSNEQLRQEIEERKRTEAVLKQSEGQLESLSSQLLTFQEDERKRVTQELHDSVGQTLAALKYSVENSISLMRNETTANCIKSLEELIPRIQNAVEEVDRIGRGLHPSILDDLGILATFSWFCREFEAVYSDIHIEKELTLAEADVPEPLKVVIYRIVQESLNNIAKHSCANHVLISLEKKDHTIALVIKDNGKGFDLQSTLSPDNHKIGLGLISMIKRAELSGGSLAIKSTAEIGTTVCASWPC
jgi:signal transduction histidine kinase